MARQKLNDAQRLDWLRLTRSENIGPVTFRKLINRYGGASAALEALPELSRRGGIKRTIRICSAERAEAEIETVHALGARHVALNEAGYPALLQHIDSPPPILIIKGREELADKHILSVVGARNASAVGHKLTSSFVAGLCAGGLVIGSGLARGIDTTAHKAALKTGTIAVVAGGIDVIYPPENADLQQQISEEGLLIAEMPPGVAPKSQYFPRRNRLVSGMSLGVLVTEAAIRSGSLITARLAGEQGRDVFAVPGSPLDPRAGGTNKLLQDGAQLVLNAANILQQLESVINRTPDTTQEDFFEQEEPVETTEGYETPPEDAGIQIFNLLSIVPIETDELIRRSGYSAASVHSTLMELDIAGRIIRHSQQLVSLLPSH